MFKTYKFIACFGERTGYQIHGSRFGEALDTVFRENAKEGDSGHVNITLLDTVSASNATEFPESPSILYNIWESTAQPAGFLNNLKNYDMLWVGSEAQKGWSVADGIPEEYVKVVPEGVDPEIYKPHLGQLMDTGIFHIVHVGQWQHRKSTKEIIEAFLKAFPANKFPNVQLELSVDTLFPSDQYKSTEERLAAYGFNDPRISVIHFEERAEYVRRLQSAHCFVSCSRSEGWGLPIIEAAACGVPTIVADWGGSTEYSSELINVRIKELKKPEGIFGNWDVPGHWSEPDYDHLAECMLDVYNNYSTHKEKALKASENIRTKFSWKAAAVKAYKVLEELYQNTEQKVPTICPKDTSVENDIISYAKKLGFEITGLHKRKAIFTIDSHPNTQERIDTLVETIKQVKPFGYPILLVSHLPLPKEVQEMVDYCIYDKRDILSGDDKPVYSRVHADGKVEKVESKIPCHALAWLHNFRNAIDFCKGKFDWIYNISSDVEGDVGEWLDKVYKSEKNFIAVGWENQTETITGQLIAARVEFLDQVYPRIETWDGFKEKFGDDRFCCERGFYKIAKEKIGIENIDFVPMELGNRFDQVDREAWKDDIFQHHFVEGPFFQIDGISKKEYDVEFTAPTGEKYDVKMKCGMWGRPATKYYRDWTITARHNGEIKFQTKMDLKGKNVLISMGSKALGDTIAWMPYVEEFRKKYECHVICSGWWQEIFDYPEIEFVKPGSQIPDVYASYSVGCYDEQPNMNLKDWRLTNLQQVAADILGVEYKPIRAKLIIPVPVRGDNSRELLRPYVCFSEFSTMKNKLWNREGAWQKIVDHLLRKGIRAVSVSNESTGLCDAVKHNGQSIQNTIADVNGCEFYIGLNAGPSWIAYALDKPCLMITGVSQEWNDFPNLYRVAINEEVCGVGCFNDPSLKIDRGWDWCGRNKNYVCTSAITEQMVINMIDKIKEDLNG